MADDGEQALHVLFREEQENDALPDLILLDWNLPKVSGSKVLQIAKQHKKLRQIPILVFSASEADEDIHSAYGDYANGYIVKPGSPERLASIVEAIEHFWVTVAQLPKVSSFS